MINQLHEMAFKAKQRPALGSQSQVPRLTAIVDEGSVSLLYQHLADAQMVCDETAISLLFGSSHRVMIRGEKLGSIFNEICGHHCLRVQACSNAEDATQIVESVEVGQQPPKQDPAGAS